MNLSRWKSILRIISILIFLASFTWLVYQPGFEPLLGFLSALTGLLLSNEQEPDDIKYRRSRETIIKKVKSIWINGVLNNSLANTLRIDLGFELLSSHIPSGRFYVFPSQKKQIIRSGTKIIDLFNDTDGSLLILGEPGSGKTSTALELANELLATAEGDKVQPVPIFLNLSTWGRERKSIFEWLINELHITYQVNKKFARKWIKSEPFRIFLDGLDEIPDEYRSLCVIEINKFMQEYSLTDIVVCCRALEYERLETPIKINYIINILPLTEEQINVFFTKGGKQLATAKTMLDTDNVIKLLANTPLNLQIIALAYGEKPTSSYDTGSIDEQRSQLFNIYIQQMLKRSGISQYSGKQAIQWLSRLAQEMNKRSQSVFYLESIDISWLPSVKYVRLFYSILAMLSIIIGLAFTFIHDLGFGSIGKWGWIAGTILVCYFLLIPVMSDYRIIYVERVNWSLSKAIEYTVLTITCGLIGVSIRSIIEIPVTIDWQTQLLYWIIWGTGGGAIWGMLGIHVEMQAGEAVRKSLKIDSNKYSDQRIKNVLGWLNENLSLKFLICLFSSLYYGQLYTRNIGTIGGIIFSFCFGMATGVISGVTFNEIEERNQPNQSVRISGQNAIKLFLASMICGLAGGLLIAWGFENKLNNISLINGVAWGISGGIYIGLISSLLFGGAAFIQYNILRKFLSTKDYLPSRLVEFLEDMASAIILRKVGGGYIFIHRWLFEHFLDKKI